MTTHIVETEGRHAYKKTLCGIKLERGVRRCSRERYAANLEIDVPHCDDCAAHIEETLF